jgi:predicted ATPase
MSYNLQLKNHYYIITGGPGAGKSTLLNALALRGFPTVAEAGRQIIQDELAKGGNAIHSGDRLAFRDKMMSQSVADYFNQPQTDKPVFFDRGIPDLIGYSYLIHQPIPEEHWQISKALRYHPTIFMAPPWAAIYEHDDLRKQDFQEAQDTYQAIKKGYIECGYHILELPLSSISERVHFVLNNLA